MFNIIISNLKIVFRDKSTMFLITLFPIILVFLLGNLLGNMDAAEGKIQPMKVEYKVETDDKMQLSAIESFLEGLKDNDDLTLKETDDIKESISHLNKGELASVMVFTDTNDIELYEGLDSIQNRAMKIILNTFCEYTASYKILTDNDPSKFEEVSSILEEDNVVDKDFGYERTMLDYYAVAMIVMILFMGGAIGGVSIMYEGRLNGTLSRMAISPKSRGNIYIQTVLGSLPQTLMQVIMIMVSSVLIFGANYAQSINSNILLIITFVFVGIAVNSVFTAVGIFVKRDPTMMIMPVLWTLMFISGTFSKEIYIQSVTELSPVWLIQNAAFQLTVFDKPEQCILVSVICLGITIITTTIGALLFNRKGVLS